MNQSAWCLKEAGITAKDLDYVVFYDKPILKFERLLETYLSFAPQGLGIVPDGYASLVETEIAYPGPDSQKPWI